MTEDGRRVATEPGPGLRARKKARTRAALRSAALARARAQGPDGFTLEEVCSDVDVSARTFFNYFPSKESVLVDWDDDAVEALIADVRARPVPEDPMSAVLAVVGDLVAALTTSPVWHEQIELLRAHPGLMPRMASVDRTVEEALIRALTGRDGRPVAELEARTAAAIAMAALRVTITAWLADPNGLDARALFGRVVEHGRTMLGAGPPAGGTRPGVSG